MLSRSHSVFQHPNTPAKTRSVRALLLSCGMLAMLALCWSGCGTSLPGTESLPESRVDSGWSWDSGPADKDRAEPLSEEAGEGMSEVESSSDTDLGVDGAELSDGGGGADASSDREGGAEEPFAADGDGDGETVEQVTEKTPEKIPEPPSGDAPPLKVFWAGIMGIFSSTAKAGARSAKLKAEVYISGVTDRFKHPHTREKWLRAEFGYGPYDVNDPSLCTDPAGWPAGNWSAATFSGQTGPPNQAANNYGFQGQLPMPSRPGSVCFGFRFSYLNGPWKYADLGYHDQGAGGRDKGPLHGAPYDGSKTGRATKGHLGRLAGYGKGDKLHVVTFNLQCLKFSPGRRFDHIASELARRQVDVVLLQEVCKNKGGVHSAELMAKRMNSHSASSSVTYRSLFVQTHRATWKENGAGVEAPEGLGLITSFPVHESGYVRLNAGRATPKNCGFERSALWARLITGAGAVTVVSTHLTHNHSSVCDRWRAQQQATELLKRIRELSAESPGGSLIIGGDFNSNPNSATHKVMTNKTGMIDVWGRLNPGMTGGTTHRYKTRIDYIYLGAGGPLTPLSARLLFEKPVNGLKMSDHLAVLAEFEVR